jgi:hypothetical protein
MIHDAKAPLHGFLGHQPDHGDNPLFLAVFLQSGRSRPLLLIERTLKDSRGTPNRLRRQGNNAGDARRADPFGYLQQRHRPKDDAYLLNTAARQSFESQEGRAIP